jgi:hypothetical protein
MLGNDYTLQINIQYIYIGRTLITTQENLQINYLPCQMEKNCWQNRADFNFIASAGPS